MSKERELLVESLEWMQELKYVWADERDSGDRLLLIADINKVEQLLAQPEQEQEPLSDATIAELWGDKYAGKTFMVKNFARAIEKAHGIGAES